jgi:hypothetical protein
MDLTSNLHIIILSCKFIISKEEKQETRIKKIMTDDKGNLKHVSYQKRKQKYSKKNHHFIEQADLHAKELHG